YLASLRARLVKERGERILQSRLSGDETPPPVTQKSLDGETVSLADLKGKLAVIKFWGLWCEPCRLEMPAFGRFADQYSDVEDVVIITVDNDPKPETAREWMKNHGYKFEVLLDSGY